MLRNLADYLTSDGPITALFSPTATAPAHAILRRPAPGETCCDFFTELSNKKKRKRPQVLITAGRLHLEKKKRLLQDRVRASKTNLVFVQIKRRECNFSREKNFPLPSFFFSFLFFFSVASRSGNDAREVPKLITQSLSCGSCGGIPRPAPLDPQASSAGPRGAARASSRDAPQRWARQWGHPSSAHAVLE